MKKSISLMASAVSIFLLSGAANANDVECKNITGEVTLKIQSSDLPLVTGKKLNLAFSQTVLGSTTQHEINCLIIKTADEQLACGQDFDGSLRLGVEMTVNSAGIPQLVALTEYYHGGYGSDTAHDGLTCNLVTIRTP